MSPRRKLPPPETLADLVEQLGGVPLNRIRLRPLLGTAREEDIVASYKAGEKAIYELVDGVFVEKMWRLDAEAVIPRIVAVLHDHVTERGLGQVLEADLPMRFLPGLIRVPDVCFFPEDRLRGGDLPDELPLAIIPDLVVEVVDRSNTPNEMRRKREEYFEAGIQVLWEIQPKTQTADVYTSRTEVKHIPNGGTIDGGELLPGFTLSLAKLFNLGKREQGKSKTK